jgi:hypothetical protein
VNARHLRTFVWLRWRLLVNSWRRGGSLNAALMIIVAVASLVLAVPLFLGAVALGMYLIPKAAPAHLMYVWDAMVVAFLFFWCIGLLVELQRSEPLALSKFLHLPVSANAAFLINFFSSLLRFSLVMFVPLMSGYALALVFAKGWPLLPVFPLLAAFLLMITALTYQLQGWLGALMSNPRRRRTVIVVATGVFVLVCQLPNLVNFSMTPRIIEQNKARFTAFDAETKKTLGALHAGQITIEESNRRLKEAHEALERSRNEDNRRFAALWERRTRLVNAVLPVGWLPLGVATAAEGDFVPSLAGLAGMALIGSVSLWRAYRTMVHQYQGGLANQGRPPIPVPAPVEAGPAQIRPRGTLLVEAQIPGISEPVAAIALGGFRALVRSPEAKMMLLTPLILIPVFGSMLWQGAEKLPEQVRPLLATAGMAMVLFGLLQMMGNQFGFDRDGYRVFVLSAARRRDILLGKNLVFAPLALVMAAILLPVVQAISPMRVAHLLALVPQFVSMYLLLCLLTNLMSIYAPFHVAAGTMKPSNPRFVVILVQSLMFLLVFPLTQGATLLPLGIEAVLGLWGWTTNGIICLVLSLALCAAVVGLYFALLGWQGELLQDRERKILEGVTAKAS